MSNSLDSYQARHDLDPYCLQIRLSANNRCSHLQIQSYLLHARHGLDPDQDGCFVRHDLALGPNCLQRLSADDKVVKGR